MSDPITKAFTSEQTLELRREYLERRVAPTVRQAFKDHPQLQSALMLVAQYWDDEADDAVHLRMVFSELGKPDVTSAYDLDPDPNLPSGLELDYRGGIEWNSNDEPIALFAAFCKEESDQHMGVPEAYAPYALFRRAGNALQIEIVGVMLRPWLDGVEPQWRARTLEE